MNSQTYDLDGVGTVEAPAYALQHTRTQTQVVLTATTDPGQRCSDANRRHVRCSMTLSTLGHFAIDRGRRLHAAAAQSSRSFSDAAKHDGHSDAARTRPPPFFLSWNSAFPTRPRSFPHSRIPFAPPPSEPIGTVSCGGALPRIAARLPILVASFTRFPPHPLAGRGSGTFSAV
ncbi:hypothetical protein BD310DRAFT_923991 [Dichomitus squalens]|uniref:Uncharacterized protein n=1 Tax=Dichomitus squalens TaxID=114155 RepID=A0A4Q9PZ28_9APHY|nr:hypothetical protein BD310DRAFT_923991 [Dichomitus squalens]